MTQPDPIEALRRAVDSLETAVKGDPVTGQKHIRVVADELRRAIDDIQRERQIEQAETRGQKRTMSWIFGTSAASAIGVLVMIYNLITNGLGGGK